MCSRAKRKKVWREKQKQAGVIKKAKKMLGSIHDCCGNCKFSKNAFLVGLDKCNNSDSSKFKETVYKEDYCIAHQEK